MEGKLTFGVLALLSSRWSLVSRLSTIWPLSLLSSASDPLRRSPRSPTCSRRKEKISCPNASVATSLLALMPLNCFNILGSLSSTSPQAPQSPTHTIRKRLPSNATLTNPRRLYTRSEHLSLGQCQRTPRCRKAVSMEVAASQTTAKRKILPQASTLISHPSNSNEHHPVRATHTTRPLPLSLPLPRTLVELPPLLEAPSQEGRTRRRIRKSHHAPSPSHPSQVLAATLKVSRNRRAPARSARAPKPPHRPKSTSKKMRLSMMTTLAPSSTL